MHVEMASHCTDCDYHEKLQPFTGTLAMVQGTRFAPQPPEVPRVGGRDSVCVTMNLHVSLQDINGPVVLESLTARCAPSLRTLGARACNILQLRLRPQTEPTDIKPVDSAAFCIKKPTALSDSVGDLLDLLTKMVGRDLPCLLCCAAEAGV